MIEYTCENKSIEVNQSCHRGSFLTSMKRKSNSGMTAFAGLPLYLDLASLLGLADSITHHMHVKVQGRTDEQVVLSLILLDLDKIDPERGPRDRAGKAGGGFGASRTIDNDP